MADFKQRNYYRIFTGTNQAEGYDKIHLGYEADTTEIILKKDQTTYFHMPFFAEGQTLTESSLIADGAVPGPIPALADRVYKKLGDYGNSTPWGNISDKADGQWLCSWLYAVSSEPPVWLDRYYDPGRLAYKEALEGTASFTDYIKKDPIYYDVPTTLTFESGVLYQYFHQGEQSAIKYVDTFAGEDKSRLRLNIDDWSCACPDDPRPVDKSVYKNSVTLSNFKPSWVVSLFDPGFLDRSSLSFDNTDFIDCFVNYNENYNLLNEFTVSFWVYHKDWSNATSTQLAGNLQKGGYGIFYNNLNYNPYYVVPETFYGHLFYFNQEGTVYTEKNNQLVLGEQANFKHISLNSNSEVIAIDSIKKRGVKYNHIGDTITYTRDTSGNFLQLEGEIVNMALSGDDSSVIFTSLSAYTFDRDLILKTVTPYTTGYQEQIAFDTNGNLVKELSCTDLKFDNFNQKWSINSGNKLFCNNQIVLSIPANSMCTNLAIDPQGQIWVLADSNKIYKINPVNKTLTSTYEVGVQTTGPDVKNISFINIYNRKNNNFIWYALIYHNHEKVLYQVTLDGKILRNTFLPPKLNTQDPVTATQNKDLLTFDAKGDFTGYELRRIFYKVLYKNNPQIQFKIAASYPNPDLPYSIQTASIPAHYLEDSIWHLITVALRNNEIKMYIDNYLRDISYLPINLNFNYNYKNNFIIGCPSGKTQNLNNEIGSQSIIWNGIIDTVRIYDHAIESKFIEYFVREKTIASDIEWNIQTAALQYVEVIDRFFKHRLPGSKSVFFNIRLTGSNITDPDLRRRIEEDIKLAVTQIKPSYSELLRVEWID